MNFDFDAGTAEWLDGHFAGEALRRAVFDAADMGLAREVAISVADDLMCVFRNPATGLSDGSLAVFLRADDILVVHCDGGHVVSRVFDPSVREVIGEETNGVEGWTVPWSEDAFLACLHGALGKWTPGP